MRSFAAATALAVVAVALVVALKWDEVAEAFSLIPPWALLAGTGLHVVTLVLRSEAIRIALGAITGTPLDRPTVHGVNAGAFVAGAAQPHAAVAARVALLARFGRGRAPGPAQVAISDVPIITLEAVCTAGLLAVASLAVDPWWLGPAALAGAVAALLALRVAHVRLGHLRIAHAMNVLGDTRLRVALLALVVGITTLMCARIWLLLAATELPATFPTVALLLAALGVFGMLPLGPSASPTATLATVGATGVGPALALGLAISATSICAVLAYAAGVAVVTPLAGRARASARAARGRGTARSASGPGRGSPTSPS